MVYLRYKVNTTEEKKLFQNSSHYDSVPTGKLGIIPLESCKSLGEKIDEYIVSWRTEEKNAFNGIHFKDYYKDSYLIEALCPRFGSGEAKGIVKKSVRGVDLYILVDVCNYSLEYDLGGYKCKMSPDDHFQDLKRILSACGGKPHHITVIMPFLYSSRQHKRSGRESLDCAVMLQELVNMGVNNIITFDAHDPRVQNAIPFHGFDNVMPTYQLIKAILNAHSDLTLDSDHIMVISPDEGAMQRAIYLANILGVDIGMFYKRRDFTTIVNGRNPIVAHEFLGDSVEGKDVFIIDDIIASGESILDVAKELKRRKAKRVFCFSTFGFFTNGLEVFDKCYEEGIITKIITTNLTYQMPELLERPWYISADMSKYIALIVNTLNHDDSISKILNPSERIRKRIEVYKQQQQS